MPTRFSATLFSLPVMLVLFATSNARADTWSYPAERKDRVFTFGDAKIVLTVDGRQDQRSPDFIFSVYDKGELQSQVHGISFDQVFPSPDNAFFVGLSNRGIPGTAVVVFTRKGEITLLASHGIAKFDYCDRSVTVMRRWYDETKPDVTFGGNKETKGSSGITLRNCRGQVVDLADTVLAAYSESFRSLQSNEPTKAP